MAKTPEKSRPKPRKAPKQARSQQTVEVIVEAAARILEERGHAAFSTNAVAERAGVSVGSLYQYFPRKDALIGALILRETSQLVEEAKMAARQPSGRAALRAFIAACISHQFRRPKLARLLDFEEARLPFDAETQKITQSIHEIVLEILARRDLTAQPDLEAAAQDVIAIIKGIIDAAGMRGETHVEALGARVARATFGYLG